MSLRREDYAGPDGNFGAAAEFPEPIGLVKITLSCRDALREIYSHPSLKTHEVLEIRVGGVPWNRTTSNVEPGPGEWLSDNKSKAIVLGSCSLGGTVTAYYDPLKTARDRLGNDILTPNDIEVLTGALNVSAAGLTCDEAVWIIKQLREDLPVELKDRLMRYIFS